MNPKRAKDLLSLTADKLNVPLALVDDLTSFYWNKVHKGMTHLQGAEIQASSLGTFKIKEWKIDKAILKYDSIMSKIMTTSFQKYEMYKECEDRVKLLLDLKEYFLNEENRKYQIKNKSNVD